MPIGMLPIVALLAIWQYLAARPGFPIETASSPSAIASAFVDAFRDGTMLLATMQTVQAAILGLALAVLFGVALGFAVGFSKRLDRLSLGITEIIRPVPAIALLPLSLLYFGFGLNMEASVVAFAAFWPVMIVARSAAAAIDRQLLEVAKNLEFGIIESFWKFLLPAALRQLFVGLRLGLGVALVVAITVEVAVNPRGLGYALVTAQASLRPDQVLAFLVCVGLIGWAANALSLLLERVLFKWDGVERERAA